MPVRVDLGERRYTVHFRPLAAVPKLLDRSSLEPGRTLIVTDENVAEHYLSPLQDDLVGAAWTPRSIVLPPGESTKSAAHLHTIYDDALGWGIDRHTPVIALGGGVIGDLAGFAAATLLRGLPLIHLPTSLLAQVDASVGGKTAINHPTGKNLIGAFYQPEFVCADPGTLDTLPAREYTSGLAEVVKHALIKDRELYSVLEENLDSVVGQADHELLSSIIERAVHVKARIVSTDEHEKGRRAILNFGHTFGHALERVAGYGIYSHGEAVALGMRAALFLSHARHAETVPLDRLDRVVQALPIHDDPSGVPFEKLYRAMRADKKTMGETIRFVLLDRLGHAYVTGDVTKDQACEAWSFACSR